MKLQQIAAEDVPFVPSWVGKNIAVYGDGVKGVEDTLDPSVHLPLLGDQQERLTRHAGLGEGPRGLSPRSCPGSSPETGLQA